MGTGQDLSLLWSLHFSILTQRSVFGVTCISKLKTKPCFLFCLAFFFVCVDLSLSHFYTNGFFSKLLNFMRGGIIQKLETIQPAEHLLFFVTKQQFHNFSRAQPARTDGCFWDWLNTDFIHRKNSAAVFHWNTDTLHSRDVRCPHHCLRKAALASSGWSDRYPEVKIKPFRLQALTGKHTVYERNFKRFRLTDTLFCYIQVSRNLWPDDV